MPRGPSEATVTKFLRDALAVDAVGVPELDEKARATGLLGTARSILWPWQIENCGSQFSRGNRKNRW
jgi:hypothetical protein